MELLAQRKFEEKRLVKILFVFFYCIIFYAFNQGDIFVNQFLVNDDTAQHTFWMYKWFDSNNFQTNDVIVEFAELIQPWGFYAINRVLCFFIEPLVIIKIIPFLLLLITCLYLFFYLEERLSLRIAIIGTILISNAIMGYMAGFHARAFAYPLLMAFLFYLSNKNINAVSMVLVLSSLLYPVVFLLISMTLISYQLFSFFMNRERILPKSHFLIIGLAFLIGSTVLLAKSHTIENSPMAGKKYSKSEILKMEEFGKDGRIKITPQLKPIYKQVHDAFRSSFWKTLITIISILTILFLWFLCIRTSFTDIDVTLMSLLFSGTILFIAARIFILELFIPARYLEYSIFVFSFLLVLRVLDGVPNKSIRSALAVITVSLIPFMLYSFKNKGLKDYSSLSEVYEKVKHLEGKALIAGPPSTSDQIPLFAQKSVLFSYEASHAIYYKNYWSELKQRTYDFFQAYLSDDLDVLVEFIKKYDLDYIIIDNGFFEDTGNAYFSPFREYIKSVRANRTSDDYIFLQLKNNVTEPIGERYSLLSCKDLLEHYDGRGSVIGHL